MILGSVLIGIAFFPVYVQIKIFEKYLASFNLWVYPVTLFIFIALGVISYILFISIRNTFIVLRNIFLGWRNEKEFITTQKYEVEMLLESISVIEEESLANEVKELKEKRTICINCKELIIFVPEIKKRLAKTKKLLEIVQKRKVIEEIKEETEQAKKDYEEAQRQKEIDTQREKERIRQELLMYLNNIYIKKYLNKKQIEILKADRYKQINEYCVYEKKIITVLIKTELNHSPTHEFLVWSTKRILEQIDGVYKIQDHLTKNADITFNFQNRKFALEIELGSLLRKKRQCIAKVKYLNETFKNKWMFLVSNKNLLKHYKKLGVATQRNRVYENLYKLLQNAHPRKGGGKLVIPTMKIKRWHQNYALY